MVAAKLPYALVCSGFLVALLLVLSAPQDTPAVAASSDRPLQERTLQSPPSSTWNASNYGVSLPGLVTAIALTVAVLLGLERLIERKVCQAIKPLQEDIQELKQAVQDLNDWTRGNGRQRNVGPDHNSG